MSKIIMLVLCMVVVGCHKQIKIELPKLEPIAKVEQKQEARQEAVIVPEIVQEPTVKQINEIVRKARQQNKRSENLIKRIENVNVIMGTSEQKEPIKHNTGKWIYHCISIMGLCILMFIISIVFKL